MSLNKHQEFIQACQLADQGRFVESLNIFLGLEKIDPKDATLKLLIATSYFELKEYAQAMDITKKCLELSPNHHQAHHLLGNILRALKSPQDALKAYDDEIRINPNYPDVLNDKGIVLFKLARENEALELFEKAIRLDASYADPLHNKAIILKRRAQFEEAKILLHKAIQLKKNFYEAFAELANLHLYLCEFSEGWKFYKTRFESELRGQKKFTSISPWTNSKLQGKTILLYDEQGVGDQILYGTILRDVFLTNNNFIVITDPRLTPVFKRSFSEVKNTVFLGSDNNVDTSAIDYQVAIGDLGQLFRTSLNHFSIPDRQYLIADKSRRDAYKQKLDTGKINCGISWKSLRDTIGSDKTVALKEWLPILQLEDFHFIDLQYGDNLDERNTIEHEYQIRITNIEALDKFNDIDGLLALIDACDVVITTSNVTAHLAGSLGKQTFLMVPFAKGRIWYWHHNMSQCIWYPSIKIFSQDKNEIWAPVIKDICNELQKFALHSIPD
jgi:Tfp pilus assembly protein PilF